MAQGIVELRNPTGEEFVEALEVAASDALDGSDAKASQFKVLLVSPYFSASPDKIVVDTETKQVEIHFDF